MFTTYHLYHQYDNLTKFSIVCCSIVCCTVINHLKTCLLTVLWCGQSSVKLAPPCSPAGSPKVSVWRNALLCVVSSPPRAQASPTEQWACAADYVLVLDNVLCCFSCFLHFEPSGRPPESSERRQRLYVWIKDWQGSSNTCRGQPVAMSGIHSLKASTTAVILMPGHTSSANSQKYNTSATIKAYLCWGLPKVTVPLHVLVNPFRGCSFPGNRICIWVILFWNLRKVFSMK